VRVADKAELTLAGSLENDISPGRIRRISMTATNTGNLAGEFNLAADAPAGFAVRFLPAQLTLAPGASAPFVVEVNASAEQDDAPGVVITIAPTLAGRSAGQTDLVFRVARPLLSIESANSAAALREGDLLLVSAVILNSGNAAAEDVTVALMVGDQEVDRVVISRINAGARATATLSWLATFGGDVSVVLDPDGEVVQETRDSTTRSVSFASNGVPAPLPLLALLVAAVAMRRRRR